MNTSLRTFSFAVGVAQLASAASLASEANQVSGVFVFPLSKACGVGQEASCALANAPKSTWRFLPSSRLLVVFVVRPPLGTFGVGQEASCASVFSDVPPWRALLSPQAFPLVGVVHALGDKPNSLPDVRRADAASW